MAPRPSSDTVLTSRGIGLAAAGTVVGGLGVGLATPPLVYVGVAMVASVAVGGLWLMLSINGFLSRFPFAHREVVPHPLTVGVPGRVTVTISSSAGRRGGALRRALAESLDIREQAAAELTGGLSTKATVSRTSESFSLSYSLLPSRRGRWPLGPALIHSADPLGMLRSDTSVGGEELIPVWPSVVDLTATAGVLMGQADRVVLGARSPSPDDAALRDYREGDDLRRVHWPSSARKGTMLVRSDERAGKRPATVLLDLPYESAALEWSISAAASIGLSVLDSGHPVRFFGGPLGPEHVHHIGREHPQSARADLLDKTVDLTRPPSPTAGSAWLLTAIRRTAEGVSNGEVIVGVFEPLNAECLEALVPLGDAGRAWAIVRGDSEDDADAQETATALRRAGWRATTAHSRTDIDSVWSTLLTAGDIA
ncbi:DUF58 domain-containing protein [Demequina sp.]|uniref:DUF58 domain-containing protein n=1 Tax=Demequina sp. TaxID=2050685 RepID=UPI0025BFFB3A|nr:DUF58 domain-containing protein [Demequina sp.]